ncbi:MAG: universal stress protein [Vicinamibacterales bacterium]
MIQIRRILCPVDFSVTSEHAVDQALVIAHWYEAGLTLLHVFATRPSLDLPPIVLGDADRERLLSAMRTMTARAPAGVALEYRVEEAEYVDREIAAQAAATQADLLVIGTHGRSGIQHLLLGSIAEKVMRKATCPTLVVPPRAPHVPPDTPVQFKRILCAVDFSDSSLSAAAFALSLAEEADAHVTLVHAIELPPELRENTLAEDFDIDRIHAAAAAEALRRLRSLVPEEARTYCTVETAVVEGRAYRQLLQRAAEDEVGLLVMGVHGRGVVDRLVFGSTTHNVIREARCPVLIVRN